MKMHGVLPQLVLPSRLRHCVSRNVRIVGQECGKGKIFVFPSWLLDYVDKTNGFVLILEGSTFIPGVFK